MRLGSVVREQERPSCRYDCIYHVTDCYPCVQANLKNDMHMMDGMKGMYGAGYVGYRRMRSRGEKRRDLDRCNTKRKECVEGVD
jgi:hypothetical protein